jgi:hypothetical protein
VHPKISFTPLSLPNFPTDACYSRLPLLWPVFGFFCIVSLVAKTTDSFGTCIQ